MLPFHSYYAGSEQRGGVDGSRLRPGEDRLDDLRREKGQAQHPAHPCVRHLFPLAQGGDVDLALVRREVEGNIVAFEKLMPLADLDGSTAPKMSFFCGGGCTSAATNSLPSSAATLASA